MPIRHATLVLAMGLALGTAARAQAPTSPESPPPAVTQRADALLAALSSGSPEALERLVRDHGTPAFQQRRTPQERAAMVRRVHEDFGVLTRQALQATPDGVRIEVLGTTGMRGRVTLRLEPGPLARIDAFGIDLTADDDTAASFEPPPPPLAGLSDEALTSTLDSYLATLAGQDRFSGVVLVAQAGRTRFARGYGFADRDARVPNAPDVRFNVGSITKSFTQTAVARLMSEGRLKPTDTIGALIPDYPNAEARGATVQQLLDHRAGIADFFGPDFAKAPKDRFRSNADYYRFVAPRPLTFAPGTRRQYCNGCYIVLGEIVARVSGQPYEAYVSAHVFRPAGMTQSGFLGHDSGLPDVAVGYTRRGGESLRSNRDLIGVRGSAAGGSHATAADLVRYVEALQSAVTADAMRAVDATSAPLALAGGAPGLNAFVHAHAATIVVVLANLDPPDAERLGEALAERLAP